MPLQNHPVFRLLWQMAILLLLAALTSCDTGIKTLGQKSSDSSGTGETDSETFSITLAYRKDANPDDGRTVLLQGVRGLESASLALKCGSTGATCKCYFYQGIADASPLVNTAPNGLSVGNNSLSCTLPGTADPDLYTKVRLRTSDNLKSTGFIDIKTSLTIEDVIGDLDKKNVRGIYRYACNRTFFEGEGVSATAVTCPASQRLGLISATYNYYLFNSASGGNFDSKGSNTAYDPICERQFTRLNCDGVPDLRWGLYSEQTGPFQAAITMRAAPEGDNTTSIYGYAALTDNSGNCPTGLVKVQPWLAQPQSIVQGSIDGVNPPSSFVNQDNNLNNTVIEESQPTAFLVNRQANPDTPATRCAPTGSVDPVPGSCRNASFGGSVQVQTVTYANLTPVVCAIPKDLLSGLF